MLIIYGNHGIEKKLFVFTLLSLDWTTIILNWWREEQLAYLLFHLKEGSLRETAIKY